MSNQPERPARFLQACRGRTVDRTPIWLMRQAGRYMSEYRAVRARHSMLDVINTPELATEVTLQPINAFDLDAAIIFSDILPPLVGMGLDLEFIKGVGPRLNNPITSPREVDALSTPPAQENMAGTLEAVRLVQAELKPRGIPLIGFAGAPFTLASYAIEGGGSKTYARTKTLMYTEPGAWHLLMEKLVTVIGDYLIEQVIAGADALQVFDSWAGALGKTDYIRYVQPYNKVLYQKLAQAGVPVINFSTGTTAYLDAVAASGGDVIGVDWRLPLDEAWKRIGNRAIMGNLDSVTLFAPWSELQRHVDDILDRAGGCPGHIFNLGHGILPETPVDNVRRLVDYVHEQTAVNP
ncbi:MAG: uroporphyrinogen decarboxylase [Rhodothermales bacterium]